MGGWETGEGVKVQAIQSDVPCCKVARSAKSFGLGDVERELTHRRKEGASYRSLTDYFNVRLIERAIEESDLDPAGSLTNSLFSDNLARQLYDWLTDAAESDSSQSEFRTYLVSLGIDSELLESSFVSHVTMGDHLRQCLGVEPEPKGPHRIEDGLSVIQWAQSRATQITGAVLRQLQRNELVHTGTLDVELLVSVTCADCGETMNLQKLLDRRQCRCPRTNGE